MNKIKIDEMDDARKRALYSAFWEDFPDILDADITRTFFRGKESKNSYSFLFKGSSIENGIVDVFHIAERDLFCTKYKMAVSGDGNESAKITTMHSSSLCALLFFYNISPDNPFTIDLITNRGLRSVTFTTSVFEYKSPVLNKASNMDVVLISEDRKVVLFLESKFSEYYIDAKLTEKGVSNKYLDLGCSKRIYTQSNMDKLGLSIKRGERTFDISCDEQLYIHGLRQMISHYCGIINVLNGKCAAQKDHYREEVSQAMANCEVAILGEILFDEKIGDLLIDGGKNCLDVYSKKYKLLAEIIADDSSCEDRFEILKNDLGYSLFRENSHKVEDSISRYYGLV